MLERSFNFEPQPLPLAWLYVQGSLLSVALYPKPLAKVGIISEPDKYLEKNLRKRYVNEMIYAKEKGYRRSPVVSE